MKLHFSKFLLSSSQEIGSFQALIMLSLSLPDTPAYIYQDFLNSWQQYVPSQREDGKNWQDEVSHELWKPAQETSMNSSNSGET